MNSCEAHSHDVCDSVAPLHGRLHLEFRFIGPCGGWKARGPLVLAALLGLSLVSLARAEPKLPPDSFDIDVLTAYRYGLNHDWAPASCFGRLSCPEDHRYSKRRKAQSENDAAY